MSSSFKAMLLAVLFPLSVSGQTTTPKDDSVPQSGVIAANGIKLHYLDWGGTGEAVLFISGVGDGARYFDEMARTLTDRFRVLALTRRGYGKSDKPEVGYDVPTLTEDVRQFLDAMKLTHVNLIGHSAGGHEMIHFASVYPERTRKLVFLDAAYDRREAAVIFDADPLLDRTPATAPTLHQRIEAEFFREMDVYELSYEKIKAPALSFYAIWEQHPSLKSAMDDSTKAKAQTFIRLSAQPYQFRNIERFQREVKNGEVVVLRGTNHYFFEDPKQKDAVFAQIRTFLLRR